MPVPQIVAEDQSPQRQRFLGPRVPPNLFAIALGIAGLAQAWQAAVPVLSTPQAIPDALSILDAAVWLVLAGAAHRLCLVDRLPHGTPRRPQATLTSRPDGPTLSAHRPGLSWACSFRASQAIAMTTAVTTAGIPAASQHHLNPAGKVNWISLVLSYQH